MKYQGVVHIHSTHSYDGKLSLSELKSFLVSKGISFACMAEHTDFMTPEAAEDFVSECRELSDVNFVFVPGFEVPYRDAHVLHIGTTGFVSAVANAQELEDWKKITPLVILAHPVRNKFKVDDTLLNSIDGVEVWNQQYEGKIAPRSRSLNLLKKLRRQKDLLAIGGLDFHRLEHFGSPLINLSLTELSETSVIEVLKKGEYKFGNSQIELDAYENWLPSSSQRLQSWFSIGTINFGKNTNKLLAHFGLRLPNALKQKIRTRL